MCWANGAADMSCDDGDSAPGSEGEAPAVDPLATDLRSLHPWSTDFEVLPRGEFSMVAKVAPGIHGDVFRYRWTWQGVDGEHVAVKKLRLDSVQPWKDREHDERKAHMSRRGATNPCFEDALTEIGVLQRLSAQADLPIYLIRMRGIFRYNWHAWLVTEYADGGELFKTLSLQRMLPLGQAKRYSWELLQAISYLHRHRIGHRDVSLENVVIKVGAVRLMDFGMAVRSHTAQGASLRYFHPTGKDFYRAPECYVPQEDFVDVLVPAGAAPGTVVSAEVQGEYLCDVLLPADARPGSSVRAQVYGYEVPQVDVFAAGVCLFMMLVGNPPWSKARLSDELFAWVMERDLVALQVDWGMPAPSPEMAAVMTGMTSMDPSRRWSADACLSSAWLKEFASMDVPVHAGDSSMAPRVLRTLAGA